MLLLCEFSFITEIVITVTDWAKVTGAFLADFYTPKYRGMRKHRDLTNLSRHVTYLQLSVGIKTNKTQKS